MVSYYNYHLDIASPREDPLWVKIEGIPFSSKIHKLHMDYVLKEISEEFWTVQEIGRNNQEIQQHITNFLTSKDHTSIMHLSLTFRNKYGEKSYLEN